MREWNGAAAEFYVILKRKYAETIPKYTKNGDNMDKEQHYDPYRVVLEGGCGEITEKKSRFIATVRPVTGEEEASVFIEETKKKYWDARHNCSAFVIGQKAQLTRCSDDGEPSGTAGRPMLEVLLGEGLRNVAVVVTRYFGGTLLGTGGLVRAYSAAVKKGLAACSLGTMRYGLRLRIETDYNGAGKVQYLLSQRGIVTLETAYTETVTFVVFVPQEEATGVNKAIIEATGAKAALTKEEWLYCVDKD